MRWLWMLIAAVILLPVVWSLLKFVAGGILGIVQFAIVLAVLIFLVGLIRRLLIAR